ncbi:hypothetical protein O181_014547 [Austropuccinia psidii MF-1]|uniref:Uncharacterized protein n=1 Tax=Austropuccinia psidii MF-1 TaxID=1389203 RepID=A0A9Q3C0E6_9BASI|nr:hypothetical protein [Austropuccinia psidii MF-1]
MSVLVTGSRWTNVGAPIPVCGKPTYSSSEVPISRINSKVVVKRFRRISNSPTNPNSEGSDELDSEEKFSTIPSSIPPPSLNSSTARPVLVSPMRHSQIPKPRNSPKLTSQKLQPVGSSSRRREDVSPSPFPASQVFQKMEHLHIQVTREDLNMENDDQDAVARLFRRVDKNSREVSTYANDRMIPCTDSEEMAAKFEWYEDELINYFKRTFDNLGRDK